VDQAKAFGAKRDRRYVENFPSQGSQQTWREVCVNSEIDSERAEIEGERRKLQMQESAGILMSQVASCASDDVVVTRLEGRDHSIKTLTLAFSADPFARFCYPDPVSYLAQFPSFVEAFGGKAFTCGSAYHSAGYLGTALWLPPGTGAEEMDVFEDIERTLDPSITKTVFAALSQLGISHPKEPHWYLALIGVDMGHRGRGIGSGLLQPMIDKFDREECLAYLESTNAANIPFYERFGFKLVGRIAVDDCPPLFPMVRCPQSCRTA
jgi:ribosomal protein S18 acetylase RimI-like enzyme